MENLHALCHGDIALIESIACVQDMARSFAGSASDETKFSLYMAATGFDVMMRQLAASEAEVEQMVEKYQELNNVLEVGAQLSHNMRISLPHHQLLHIASDQPWQKDFV